MHGRSCAGLHGCVGESIHVRHMSVGSKMDSMIDFERARANMVESQLRTSGVFDARVLARMLTVPREIFVPAARRDMAYVDDVQWLSAGRFMAPPAILGKLLQLAEITSNDVVLDVGAGTGYSTAVIAGLAASVIGLERDAALAETANANLAALDVANATVVSSDIDEIDRQHFDVIFMQGSLDSVPHNYLSALADGGRLVTLVQTGGVGVANVMVKSAGEVSARAEFNAVLPPLFPAENNEEFVF